MAKDIKELKEAIAMADRKVQKEFACDSHEDYAHKRLRRETIKKQYKTAISLANISSPVTFRHVLDPR